MPVYEYKCRKCGNEFEVKQGINDDALEICPLEDENGLECKGEVFRKISKNVGLVFHGKGFYLTDYARKSQSPASSAENESNASSNGTNGSSNGHTNGSSNSESKKADTAKNGAAKTPTKV